MQIKNAWRGGHQGRPGWWLEFGYDEDAVAAIKQIPATHRTWDPEEKRWWVAAEHEDDLLRLAPGLEAYTRQAALL